jgi:hypothetical protein
VRRCSSAGCSGSSSRSGWGLKSAGAASTGLKLSLQFGLIANNDGVQQAAKSASSPGSSSYGKYPSLSTLVSKYGATSSVRNAVAGVFKPYGNTATADVTHLRMSVTISIKTARTIGMVAAADLNRHDVEIDRALEQLKSRRPAA